MQKIDDERDNDDAGVTWVTHDTIRPGGDETVVLLDAEFKGKVFTQFVVTPCADSGGDND